MAMTHELDAIVLDIGLPKMNGYELMQALRAGARPTPVLMLTARDTEDEIIRGLDVGADDYLTKPFSFPELVARLQSITRRRERWKIDSCRRPGDRSGSAHGLAQGRRDRTDAPGVSTALRLVQSIDQCVPRQTLMEFVWGKGHEVGATALDVLMNSLRAKIDAPHGKKLIVTVRGSGYIFRRFRYAGQEER